MLTEDECEAIVGAMDGVELDADPDSVDALPTHELYLEKYGDLDTVATIPGKPDQRESVRAARLPLR